VSDEIKPVLSRFETALHEMHRARSVAPCDWQLDESAGPHLLLPHLQKARDLNRAANLRARLRFASGESDKAVADLLDVLKMARDCGSSPIMISFLVDVAIEMNVTETLAANLPKLKPDQLDQLAASLKQLPPSTTLVECVQWEARTFGGWLERTAEAEAKKLNDPKAGFKLLTAIHMAMGDEASLKPSADNPNARKLVELRQSATVADVRESLKRMQTDYQEMAKIVALSAPEKAKRYLQFEEELNSSQKAANHESLLRHFSVTLLPTSSRVYDRSVQLQIRRDLMELAVQVQRHGPDALKSASRIKVEYHKTETGFELQSPFGDKTEVLVVGSAK